MRNVTANAAALLSQNTGTELMVILEVEWVDDGPICYSDQDVEDCQTKILEIGGLDTSMVLEGASATQELTVVLDDTDNSIRAIYNNNDTHKRPARVFLQHKGLTSADRILIFKGELVSPISWDETQRSVSFSLMSKLNAVQVGFSMEEGDFPNIPEEALGKAWPLVFGQVCHLPAVKVRAPRRGYLEAGVGIHDFTLDVRICQAIKLQCPSRSTGSQEMYTANGETANIYDSTTVNTVGPDLECVNRRFGQICQLQDLLEQQLAHEKTTLNIHNGISFPQDTLVAIEIDGAKFGGRFSGNTFTVTSQLHPEYLTFEHVPCKDIDPLAYGNIAGKPQLGGTGETTQGAGGYLPIIDGEIPEGFIGTTAWTPVDEAVYFKPNQTDAEALGSCDLSDIATPGMIGGPKQSWEFYDALEESVFFWAPPGSEVYIETESEILYTVSLLPGTVDGVSAMRRAPNGFSYLTEVPSDRYTIYETDYVGYEVVEIGLPKRLSAYLDSNTNKSEGWEDQIYVSFTSSVGPNPCDIIEWLVNKYTDADIDAASFAAVNASLTNYPTNFYLTDRPDVFDLIKDIAYQSRCAVYVRNNTIFIKYLSTEPSSERTLSESDILSNTFVETLSETEDVYTTHNVKWATGGKAISSEDTEERKIVLKYNVGKYGTVPDSWDYYCYNLYDLVLKSSTFWLIRKSNAWKRLKFSLPIKHVDLDVGDCVTIDVARFAAVPVKAIIEAINLDVDSNTIDVDCWTPIRSGESAPYFWAWPSQQPAVATWPLDGDTNGGSGSSIEVTPPLDHILLGGSGHEDQLIITTGDLHPSDLDDTFPSVVCELSDYINFDEEPPEITAKKIAQSAARTAMESGMDNNPTEGQANGGKIITVKCGEGQFGCAWKVTLTWHRSEAQGQATARGGPASPDQNPPEPCGGPCKCYGGCPSCYGDLWTECKTVSTYSEALRMAGFYNTMWGNEIGDYWTCGQTAVLSVRIAEGKHGAGAPVGEDGEPDCGTAGSSGGFDAIYAQMSGELGTSIGATGNEPA